MTRIDEPTSALYLESLIIIDRLKFNGLDLEFRKKFGIPEQGFMQTTEHESWLCKLQSDQTTSQSYLAELERLNWLTKCPTFNNHTIENYLTLGFVTFNNQSPATRVVLNSRKGAKELHILIGSETRRAHILNIWDSVISEKLKKIEPNPENSQIYRVTKNKTLLPELETVVLVLHPNITRNQLIRSWSEVRDAQIECYGRMSLRKEINRYRIMQRAHGLRKFQGLSLNEIEKQLNEVDTDSIGYYYPGPGGFNQQYLSKIIYDHKKLMNLDYPPHSG